LRWRLDPARFRLLAVMVPLHLVAFLGLYFGAVRLLEDAYSRAGVEGARRRLDSTVREMSLLFLQDQPRRSAHLFVQALAAHRDIDLQLFDAHGRPLGIGVLPPSASALDVREFLASSVGERVWLERWGERDIVQGLTRLTGGPNCVPCHPTGVLLGAASIRLDYTAPLAAMRGGLRGRLALLVATWAVLLGFTAAWVRRTVARSGARLRAELDAVERGSLGAPAGGGLVLDPVSAELHRSLHDFLARRRQHEVEVASRLVHVDQLAHLGELAAGLAHEIKNPLAGIQGALELLRDDARAEEDKFRLFEEMLAELRRVNAILQRLLESGRPAPLRVVETDPASLIRDTVDLLAPGLRRKGVRLSVETATELPRLRSDPAKVRQVLVNLVQNAAEAARDGEVVVRASWLRAVGEVVFEVADNGPGIAPHDLERIFQPFFTTKFTGTGLGLAISKSLVEQHGGRIEVDSEPGRGTRMLVFLPCSGTLPAAAPLTPPADPAGKREGTR
jgi:signal transduction histidine kinase